MPTYLLTLQGLVMVHICQELGTYCFNYPKKVIGVTLLSLIYRGQREAAQGHTGLPGFKVQFPSLWHNGEPKSREDSHVVYRTYQMRDSTLYYS